MIEIRRALVSALLSCLILLQVAGAGYAEVVDRIIAVVNDEIITMSELQNMAKSIEANAGMKPAANETKELQHQMLDALIDRKLAKEEAKRRGMSLSEKEIDQSLEQMRQRNHLTDDEALNKALSQAGLTLKELKQQLADQLMQERLLQVAVGAKVIISEADVRRAYDAGIKGDGGGQLHLVSIKLPFPAAADEASKEAVKQKAETVVKEVKQGASFKEVAQRLSLEATDMGFVDQNDLDPRLGEALGKVKTNEVLPIQTPQGLQLIQMVERRTGEAHSYEQVAPEIRRQLMKREMEKQFAEWVKTLRAKAHIKIML
jgi:peptidyl-prolyl cis-trans isomerase SurA